ncbi:hypothetical protein ACJX0J_039164, partial [Zea mays]
CAIADTARACFLPSAYDPIMHLGFEWGSNFTQRMNNVANLLQYSDPPSKSSMHLNLGGWRVALDLSLPVNSLSKNIIGIGGATFYLPKRSNATVRPNLNTNISFEKAKNKNISYIYRVPILAIYYHV